VVILVWLFVVTNYNVTFDFNPHLDTFFFFFLSHHDDKTG